MASEPDALAFDPVPQVIKKDPETISYKEILELRPALQCIDGETGPGRFS